MPLSDFPPPGETPVGTREDACAPQFQLHRDGLVAHDRVMSAMKRASGPMPAAREGHDPEHLKQIEPDSVEHVDPAFGFVVQRINRVFRGFPVPLPLLSRLLFHPRRTDNQSPAPSRA